MSLHALILAALVALPTQMPGMPGAGAGHPGSTQPQPLPDADLPAGTVSVLVRGGEGQPAGGTDVLLVPAGQPAAAAVAQGKTSAEGRVFLNASEPPAGEVQVLITAGGEQRSVPFEIPAEGGVRFLFLRGGGGAADAAPHGHGAAMKPGKPGPLPGPTGPFTRDPASLALWYSIQIQAIEDDRIWVSLQYQVINQGKLAFDPGSHGLLLPAPEGIKGLKLREGPRGTEAGERGITVFQKVPTGMSGLRIGASGHFKYRSPGVTIRLRSSVLPILGFAAMMRRYPGISLVGDDLGEIQDMGEEHGGGHGANLLVRARPERFPRQEASFTLTGLPERPRGRSWVLAVLAALLMLGGLGTVLAVRFGLIQGGRTAAAAAGPVDQLVAWETERRLGLIDQATFDGRLAELVKR
jgi:hypothetical protein